MSVTRCLRTRWDHGASASITEQATQPERSPWLRVLALSFASFLAAIELSPAGLLGLSPRT